MENDLVGNTEEQSSNEIDDFLLNILEIIHH
jgi:hypothetical protein